VSFDRVALADEHGPGREVGLAHAEGLLHVAFGGPDDDGDWSFEEVGDESAVTLAQVAAEEKEKIVYVYDFGDDWWHDIVVEKITPALPGAAYPLCTGGRGWAPEEDSGGIWAHNEAVAAAGPFTPFTPAALGALSEVAEPIW
jgi:hypothetical protein